MAVSDGISLPPGLPPLVFLGPSAPSEDVRDLLPGAQIRPAIRRGDLYRARLLRYSVFLIIDGVFAGQDAVSPREVVEVLEDGAAVIGAASMGALRAVDCAPAGAEGVGHVYRLFRSGALNSEDEVAVLFNEERPFPAVTQSLVNVRVAVRRAARSGLLEDAAAARLVDAARAIHYSRRTWRAIFAAADLEHIRSAVAPALARHDVKRADARRSLARIARRMREDPSWAERPRRSRSVFGVLSEGRERAPAPMLGASWDEVAPGFLLWMLLSGRAAGSLGPDRAPLRQLADLCLRPTDGWVDNLDRLRWENIGAARDALVRLAEELRAMLLRSGEFDAELCRHGAVAKAIRGALAAGAKPTAPQQRLAEAQMIIAHGAQDWAALTTAASPEIVALLNELKLNWARAKAWCQRVS